MQENKKHINNQEFDQLLLGIFLEEEHDELLTNKTIDMTAAIVFNQNITYVPNVSKETELLNNLHEAFISKTKYIGGTWMNLIIVLSLIFTAILVFNLSPKNNKTPQQNEALTQSAILDTKDTTIDKSASNTKLNTIQIDSLKSTKKSNKDTNKTAKRQMEYFDDNSPNISNNYSQNSPKIKLYEPDYYAVKDPVFNVVATPDNYLINNYVQFNFNPFSSEQKYIACDPTFGNVWYSGVPFKNEFDDMVLYTPILFPDKPFYNSDSALIKFKKKYRFNISISKDSFGVFKDNTIKVKRLWNVNFDYLSNTIIRSCDTSKVKFVDNFMVIDELPKEKVKNIVNQFYFGKYEVTNKEYREFTNWVREANGFGDKKIQYLIKDSSEVQVNSDFETVLKGMSKEDRNKYTLIYKNNKLDRAFKKSIDKTHYYENFPAIYKYTFFNVSKEISKALGSNTIYIYPDTLCWVKDFTYSFNEPMTRNYNWHPAYDNYPVVGVSYWQVMAFLDWKTHFFQKYLDNSNVPYEIEYSLPTDLERGMVASKISEKSNTQSFLLQDDSWVCDLLVDSKTGTFHNALRRFLLKDLVQFGNFVYDGAFHTITVGHFKPNKSGAYDMDKNVSEWIKDTYADSWGPMFTKHIQQMEKSKDTDTLIITAIEKYYDKDNAINGQLVRGGNWADERYSDIDGENKAGINLKKYIDPSESHSTIGFRYVLHVKLKNEAEIIKEKKLLSTVGSCGFGIDAKLYKGKKIKITAAIKMKETNPKISTGHLWVRVDLANNKTGFINNMSNNPINSQEWKTYEIFGDVAENATKIYFGALMTGNGKMWMDDFKFYVKEGRKWVPINIENSSFENGTKEEIAKKWYLLGDEYNIIPTEEDHFEGKRCISIEKRNE